VRLRRRHRRPGQAQWPLRRIDETIPANGEDGGKADEAAGEEVQDEELTLITQRGVANIFTARHAGRLRYCHNSGGWFLWTGTHWQRQKTELAYYHGRELAAELSELFQSWSAFAADNHVEAGSSKAFGETLAGHGFARGRDLTWGRHYVGIRLKRQHPHSEPHGDRDPDAWQREP
jgi:hypothetical protein